MKAHQIAREHTLEQLSATREDLVDLARRKGDVQKEACGRVWREWGSEPSGPRLVQCSQQKLLVVQRTHVCRWYLLANRKRHQHQVITAEKVRVSGEPHSDWEHARSKKVSAAHSWIQIMSPSCQMLVTACAKSSLAFT